MEISMIFDTTHTHSWGCQLHKVWWCFYEVIGVSPWECQLPTGSLCFYEGNPIFHDSITRLAITKVPAHSGVPGNERADELARTAPPTVPIIYTSTPITTAKAAVKDSALRDCSNSGRPVSRGLTRSLFPTINSRQSVKHFSFGHYLSHL